MCVASAPRRTQHDLDPMAPRQRRLSRSPRPHPGRVVVMDLFAAARQRMLDEREKAMVRLDTAAGTVEAAQQEHAIALAEVNVWAKALAALGEAPVEEPK